MNNDTPPSVNTSTSSQPRASSYRSEELLRLVIENVEDYAVFIISTDGNFASWNPGVEKLLGYAEEEFIGRSSCDIFTHEDNEHQACQREMSTAAREGRAEDQRWHLRKDGSRFWANGLMIALKDDAGSLRGFAKIMRDETGRKHMEEELERRVERRTRELSNAIGVLQTEVTERERAEAALHKEREFLNALLESIEDGIVACDAEGKLTLFNRVTRQFHGLSDEPLPPEEWATYYDLYESDGVTPMETDRIPLFRAWHDGQVRDAEMVIAPKEGESRTLLASGRALFDAKNQKIGAVVSMHDVTAQRRAEEERLELAREQVRRLEAETANKVKDELINQIKVAEERYRSFVTATSTLLWSADAHGNIVEIPDWNALTGQSADTLQERTWLEALHPEDREPTKRLWLEAIRTRSLYYAEFRILSPDGSYKYHAARAVPVLSADGTVREWIGSGSDINERKEFEQERERLLAREQEARRQAEEANSLKDEFLATLSHELRTPLTSILGWAQLSQINDFDSVATKNALRIIERNARAQSQLIEDLLDTSRIITGKLRLDVRAVDLAVVITAATDTLRPAAEAKSIRLHMLLDPQAGQVSGDPDRLQQVVWNLVSNSIKFTPKGGRVQVRLERVNSHIEITVSDTGDGIPPEFLPHVFDRFRQANQTTTRIHGGLGIGLAIVRQLVELHGGTIHAESEGDAQGATFTVCLPLLPMRVEPANDSTRMHAATKTEGVSLGCPSELEGLRVLVVDDEPDTRELLVVVLSSCGAKVTTATSAAEALERIEQEPPDVLISDIGMPEEDGFSLISKVRALPIERGGGMPAAALTAYARAEDRVRALRSGFQMHVAKPVEPAELITVVANLAGRNGNATATQRNS